MNVNTNTVVLEVLTVRHEKHVGPETVLCNYNKNMTQLHLDKGVVQKENIQTFTCCTFYCLCFIYNSVWIINLSHSNSEPMRFIHCLIFSHYLSLNYSCRYSVFKELTLIPTKQHWTMVNLIWLFWHWLREMYLYSTFSIFHVKRQTRENTHADAQWEKQKNKNIKNTQKHFLFFVCCCLFSQLLFTAFQE